MLKLLVPRISDPSEIVEVEFVDMGEAVPAPDGCGGFTTVFRFLGRTEQSHISRTKFKRRGGSWARKTADIARLRDCDLDLQAALDAQDWLREEQNKAAPLQQSPVI
jgi:hypothetical protein